MRLLQGLFHEVYFLRRITDAKADHLLQRAEDVGRKRGTRRLVGGRVICKCGEMPAKPSGSLRASKLSVCYPVMDQSGSTPVISCQHDGQLPSEFPRIVCADRIRFRAEQVPAPVISCTAVSQAGCRQPVMIPDRSF